ncbi:MAG TPA: hypothetical protein VFI52_07595 [Gemmatimonadaceae bacterium]|nr:hypothetical protein [Gemmatimonadaceae bacterium]
MTTATLARAPGVLFTRGSTLRSTLEYLERTLSLAEREAVLSRLTPAARTLVERAGVTDDVAYQVALDLWRSADVALAPKDPQWAEHAGAEAIRLRGMQLYSGLLLKPTPEDFLAQHISLFQRYYRPGDMKVAERAPGRAVARLVGFDPSDSLFCRRLSGGWLAAIEIAGGRDPVVHHARCVMEGDLFCEWEVRWK